MYMWEGKITLDLLLIVLFWSIDRWQYLPDIPSSLERWACETEEGSGTICILNWNAEVMCIKFAYHIIYNICLHLYSSIFTPCRLKGVE